jgi:hypothetical protein
VVLTVTPDGWLSEPLKTGVLLPYVWEPETETGSGVLRTVKSLVALVYATR